MWFFYSGIDLSITVGIIRSNGTIANQSMSVMRTRGQTMRHSAWTESGNVSDLFILSKKMMRLSRKTEKWKDWGPSKQFMTHTAFNCTFLQSHLPLSHLLWVILTMIFQYLPSITLHYHVNTDVPLSDPRVRSNIWFFWKVTRRATRSSRKHLEIEDSNRFI